MDDIKRYFERKAPDFDSYYHEPSHGLFARVGHEVFRKPGLVRRFKATMDLLGDVTGHSVLDVGCGSGPYSVYLWQKGAKVTGVDLATAMIERAHAAAHEAGWSDADLRVGDVMEFAGQTRYDALIAIGVFDYLAPGIRKAFLEKLTSLCQGPVIATFPKLLTPQMPVRTLYFVGKETPVYFYTAGRIRRLAKSVGYSAQFVNCGPIWTIAFHASRKLL
jgi:cyclopropane fatty-acyl-phospholipid synthase-like methyltransferase